MEKKRIAVETTGEAYLALLGERGIDYFFGNGGTDFPPIIEAFAKLSAEGRLVPKPILVPHEMAAVSMAHGYTMVTGRPQVVMVHVSVGTSNALTGVINASRMNIPMFFTAGRTPITESGMRGSRAVFIHWGQESFDQAAMLREFVKWDYELRNFEQLETVVDRALGLAESTPKGPVYLSLPREVLSEAQKEFSFFPSRRTTLPTRIHPDPAAIEQAADMLAGAKHPVIQTGSAGRDPAAVAELVALAETSALPVYEDRMNHMYMNFPTNHPLHQGYDVSAEFDKADVILIVESDVPWIPSRVQPRMETRIIQLGIDPNFSNYPIRGFPSDLQIRSETAAGLVALRSALEKRLTGREKELAGRKEGYAASHAAMHQTWSEAAQKVSTEKPIDNTWVSRCIGNVMEDKDIIINEYDLDPTQVTLTEPGTFFDHPSSAGLGWGFGAALGAKLASPDRTVFLACGDGAYIFSNPVACHWVSRASKLPIVVVVFNNATWGSVKRNAKMMYPDGWAVGQDAYAFTSLEPSPAFEKICEASGGYGERVEEPDQVLPALERALRAVKEEGRQALLNIICKKP
ncbi:MAG: thiamine pyrophosphate-requiring protein [bacterium]|nr:thiamine pyrophosphate-requiring protein [bacterium]